MYVFIFTLYGIEGKVMEESPGLRIDPEEDEIFFYEITEKELGPKVASGDISVQQGTGILSGHRSDENKQSSEDAGLNIGNANPENDVKAVVKLEHVPHTKLPINSSGTAVVAEGILNICENIGEKPTVVNDETNNQEEYVSNENVNVEVNLNNTPTLKEKKKETNSVLNQTDLNIPEDHNYSTPVKTVIDKNILKTPKTVVKADKDGGFLKVLSEIALVKAEVDENTLDDVSIYSKKSVTEQINNVDNKENENCFQENIMHIMKSNEGAHIKSSEGSIVGKLSIETQQLSEVTEMIKDNFRSIADFKDIKESEAAIEDGIMENADAKSSSPCEGNGTVDETDMLCGMECANSCKESLDDTNGFEVIFENLTTEIKKSVKEEEMKKLVAVSNLIQLDSFTAKKSSREDHDSDEGPCKNHVDEELQIRIIPEINLIDETLPNGKEEETDRNFLKNEITIEDGCHKKFLRRRTMNLLQELSEIVNQKQVDRDSVDCRYAVLSEEAAKVIQKLKAVAIDDSITSPDRYFDLDNLNESFFSIEVSDILNDTLSKPLDLLTSKDVELLLEKINSTTLEDKLQSQNEITEVLDAEKENLCQNKVQDTLKRNMESTEKICENTPNNKFASSIKFQKTPASLKAKVSMLQYDNHKITPIQKCLFENKKADQKPLTQSQANQNAIRVGGCRTAEKAKKANTDTKIPKLASTASKIPIKGSGQIQNRIPTLHKTPYQTATRSLKFNNIKSPVQAYINTKAPVLVSNVKGKPDAGFSAWTKDVTSDTKITKPQVETKIPKNIHKSNLPFVNYRSAIPLKLEKSPESRLPRLAPKMQKLILGNSPVIAKHEGRIKLATTNRPQTNMRESSLMLNPNEVSVIVRKVALNSDIKK